MVEKIATPEEKFVSPEEILASWGEEMATPEENAAAWGQEIVSPEEKIASPERFFASTPQFVAFALPLPLSGSAVEWAFPE